MSSPDGQISRMTRVGWFCCGSVVVRGACHPTDLPPGYHTYQGGAPSQSRSQVLDNAPLTRAVGQSQVGGMTRTPSFEKTALALTAGRAPAEGRWSGPVAVGPLAGPFP